MLKHPRDHLRNGPQSSSHATEYPNSGFRQTDSPTLGAFISKYLMVPRYDLYSKVILLS
jgi:hypothetical protein